MAGFYEWLSDGAHKLPYYIRPQADDGLLLAGVWDRWRSGAETLDSFAVESREVRERCRLERLARGKLRARDHRLEFAAEDVEGALQFVTAARGVPGIVV